MARNHITVFFIIWCSACVVCKGQPYERLMEWGSEYNDNIADNILAVEPVGDGHYLLLSNLKYYEQGMWEMGIGSGYSVGSGMRLVDSRGDTVWSRRYRTHVWVDELTFFDGMGSKESARDFMVVGDEVYLPYSIFLPCYYSLGFRKAILKLSLDDGEVLDYKVFMGDTLCRKEMEVYLSVLDDDLIALHSRDGSVYSYEYTSVILDGDFEVLDSLTYELPPYETYGEGYNKEGMEGFFWGIDTMYDWEYPQTTPNPMAYQLELSRLGHFKFFCSDFQGGKVLAGLTGFGPMEDTADHTDEYRTSLILYEPRKGVQEEVSFGQGIIRDVEFLGDSNIVVLLEKINFRTTNYWYSHEENPVRVILMDGNLNELGHRDYGYDYVVPRDIKVMENDSFVVVGYQSTGWFPDSTARSKDMGYFLLDHLDNITYGGANSSGQMELMPNPSNGFVILQLPDHADPSSTQVHIYDASGRLIRRIRNLEYHRTEIDAFAFPSGMYLVSVIDKTGDVETKRLIKR